MERDNGGGCEAIQQGSEYLLALLTPVEGRVLVSELVEGVNQLSEVLNEPQVVECPDSFHVGWGGEISKGLKLGDCGS